MKLVRIKTAPQWLVMLTDMLVVTLSYVLIVLNDISLPGFSMTLPHILLSWLVVVAVFFICTFLGKSHARIIRLSVTEDLYREFIVVLSATVTLILINLVLITLVGWEIMRYREIVLTCFVAFSLLVLERLMIKHTYAYMTQSRQDRKRVVVLGTSLSSLILANMLKSEVGGKYEPVALLNTGTHDADTQNKGGFRVLQYDPETIADLFMANGIHALLFSSADMDLVRRNYADVFMHNNLRMLSINQMSEFLAHDQELADEAGGEADAGSQREVLSSHVREVQIEDLLGRDPIVLKTTLVQEHIRGAVVLVTGACGSIGSEIVRHLATYEAGRIILLDQAETPMHDLALELKHNYPSIEFVPYIADVQNKKRVERVFKQYRPQFVFHAAAYKHVPMMELNPSEAVLTNVMGTKNVADLSLKYDVFKFVMISTDKAVNPSNIMGCTKRLAEIYTQTLFFEGQRRKHKTQFITTRFGNVLGSNGSVIPLFRRQIEQGGPVTVTHKDIIRYFMTIPEACSLVLEAGCMGHGGEIYIFDMGQPVKIYDLATRMISLAGLRPGVDIKIKEIGLRPGEKLYEETLNDKEKTTATQNKKIMIAKVRTYEWADVSKHIDQIIGLADAGSVHDMVVAMKQLVPEYKSLHSRFEAIDQELATGTAPVTPVTATPETEVYY